MAMQFDLKTGQPTREGSTATEESTAEGEAGAVGDSSPLGKSDFERELEAAIGANPAVAWLRDHPLVYHGAAFGVTVVAAALLYAALRLVVFLPLMRLAQRRDNSHVRGAAVAHAVRESAIINPLAWILPFVVAWRGMHLWPGLSPAFAESVGRVLLCIAIAFGLVAGVRLLVAVDGYVSIRVRRPGALRGYVQALGAAVYVVGAIAIIAILLGRSPLLFLTGVGAFTAVLAVVLKDTLVSMLANIIMTTGDTLRVGDWVEIKQHSIDGRVETISLTSTRIRNWDETIATVPNSRFISDVFVNYRTGDPRGGRRLRRTLRIDQRLVRELTDAEIEAIRQDPDLRESYEIALRVISDGDAGRRLTNLAHFRMHVERWLARHPKVDPSRPLIVRQNEPTTTGVPIDIVAFLHDCPLVEYEATQAAMLDHLVALTANFSLRLYQA